MELKNFEILYLKYSTKEGKVITAPKYGEDVLIWIVAKKLKSLDTFAVPQQAMWLGYKPGKRTGEKGPFRITSELRKPFAISWKLLVSVRNDLRQFFDR